VTEELEHAAAFALEARGSSTPGRGEAGTSAEVEAGSSSAGVADLTR